MTYAAVPDRRMPYDTDGTVVAVGGAQGAGITGYASGTQMANLQGVTPNPAPVWGPTGNASITVWFFFPGEQREVTAAFLACDYATGTPTIQGSNDTTNGVDGTWETATISGGFWSSGAYGNLDDWRTTIRAISFTGPKAVIRIQVSTAGGGANVAMRLIHLYGAKAAGQTPDDLLFIDSDAGTAEFTSVEDFGDRPLGTSVVRQFKIKNGSATHTASTINIQCNDSDFAISTDSITWVVTINLASLAAGASSPTYYTKNTTPAPGNVLGPRFARITAIVTGGWA